MKYVRWCERLSLYRYVYTQFSLQLKGAYIPFVMLYDNNRFIFRKCDNNFIWIYCSLEFSPKILFWIRKHYGGNLNRFHFKSVVMTTIIYGKEKPILPHIHKVGSSFLFFFFFLFYFSDIPLDLSVYLFYLYYMYTHVPKIHNWLIDA